MLDRSTGELWIDEFYSLGHNEWKEYKDDAIINLIKYTESQEDNEINMINVKEWAEIAINEYNK